MLRRYVYTSQFEVEQNMNHILCKPDMLTRKRGKAVKCLTQCRLVAMRLSFGKAKHLSILADFRPSAKMSKNISGRTRACLEDKN